jgi:hypothetical protein
MWGRVAGPITLLCCGAFINFGVPFRYSPLAALPAIIFYAVLRVRAWTRRKAGKRFDQYDAEDFSW